MYLLKRTRNLFGVLLILILICLLLASCTEAPDGGDNDTPQNGTEGDTPPEGETPDDSTQPPEEETSWKDKPLMGTNQSGVGISPPFLVRFYVDTSEINVGESLPLVLCYGDGEQAYPEPGSPPTSPYVIIMENIQYDNGKYSPMDEMIIAEYADYYTSTVEEYIFIGRTVKGRLEHILIPAEWFAYERGRVNIKIRFENDIHYVDGMLCIIYYGVELYYVKTGDTIKLFSSYYDFNNYGK